MILKIKNLKLETILGIHDWEQHVKRPIIINLEIEGNFEKSLTSDNIADTIDYDKISNEIKEIIENNKFQLIEKMTQQLLDKIMQDSRITRCKIEVDKVGAINFVESASITLEQIK